MHEVSVDPPGNFQDRRTGLIIFGILLILLGCLNALMIPISLFGLVLSGHLPGSEQLPVRLALPSLCMYSGLAVTFIWLGIGSVQCRRWARALLLVIACIWLIAGIEGCACAILIIPQAMSISRPGFPPLSAATHSIFMQIALAMDAVLLVIIPSAMLLFYRSKHVKMTCEVHDPMLRWTDACPLPVLALVVLLTTWAAFMPTMIVSSNSIVPFFGVYLGGVAGATVLLIFAAIFAWSARACYKLKILGWWAALFSLSLWILSCTITTGHLGLMQMYERMGMPERQLAMFQRLDFLNGSTTWLYMTVVYLPLIGFVVYTKRYFQEQQMPQRRSVSSAPRTA